MKLEAELASGKRRPTLLVARYSEEAVRAAGQLLSECGYHPTTAVERSPVTRQFYQWWVYGGEPDTKEAADGALDN